MWANQATQDNVAELSRRGVVLLGPEVGEQACGDVGLGRMLEPLDIAQAVSALVVDGKPLRGKSLVLTAGPTVEAIDPVRYISNHSSGKMGYALARAAQLAGADVTLVSGPVHLAIPYGVNVIQVTSAAQMFAAVKQTVADADIFIGCAAVADYTPVEVSCQKIKKNDPQMSLLLKRNPDILAWVASQPTRPFVVGFAAESQSLKEFAIKKLHKKNLDLICANDISCAGLGFNSDNNQLLLLDSQGHEKLLQVASKEMLARQVVAEVAARI